jgi:lipoprotein-releasing system permease protein
MFHPPALFIGLRYVRTRSQGFFVSFISWVSMLGVCIGVAALITVLSVMNGFESELRGRLLSLASHATISGSPERMQSWRELAVKARAVPGVAGVAPYVETRAMLGRGLQLNGALIRGVLPNEEKAVSDIGKHMKVGSMQDLVPGEQHLILGAGLAWMLEAQVGDELTVLIPQVAEAGESFEIRPRIQTFTVSGIFEVGSQEHDNVLAVVHMDDAAALVGTAGLPTGLRLRFTDIFAAPTLVENVARALGGGFVTSDWSRENASYFRAVRIEKTMMTLILMLIVAVAAFNIVAALVMVVNEKRMDIAILRTLGLAPASVIAIFITQGVVIGWFGTLLGLLLGLTLAFNVDVIVPALESLFHMHIMDPTVYYISQIPSEVHWPQVTAIGLTALILTVSSTIYPALRGARTEPAEALRYG